MSKKTYIINARAHAGPVTCALESELGVEEILRNAIKESDDDGILVGDERSGMYVPHKELQFVKVVQINDEE